MSQMDFNEKFRRRTARLSLMVIDWYAGVDRPSEALEILGPQLIRSVTATAAGFRAACRSATRAERAARLSAVVESGDQTLYWLELIEASECIDQQVLSPIYEEALEILKVMATHRKNLSKV